MKTIAFRNRMIGVLAAASVAAVLTFSLLSARTVRASGGRAQVVAHSAVQVADGSESNGGKGGGKGGAKLLERA